jgi:AraC-like DNA-binding protein
MKKENFTHPIIEQENSIYERGLMVFDDICNMPVIDESYTSPFMTVCLCMQGNVRGECDMRPYTFRPHAISVLAPDRILCVHEVSDDYRAMLLVMSPQFRTEMIRRFPSIYNDNYRYMWQADMVLTNRQFETLHMLFVLLHTVSQGDSPYRTDMLANLLEVLFLTMQDYRCENGYGDYHPSAQEQLFARFYEAIIEHYRESHEVRFYASLLHLTPKYFSTIIKQQTGINALQWINSYITIQAKSLLRHRELTIQQVALQLGFADQAAFSRYFKNNAGMSPTDYRQQYA